MKSLLAWYLCTTCYLTLWAARAWGWLGHLCNRRCQAWLRVNEHQINKFRTAVEAASQERDR